MLLPRTLTAFSRIMIRATEPKIRQSSVVDGNISVAVDVLSDGSAFPAKTKLWFDVPEAYAADLSVSGNAWLALLAPLAVHLRQPLQISAPVDSTLYSNVQELMSIWACWYPSLQPVPIEAELSPAPTEPAGRRTATLFSGGVDAWFTLLRHLDGTAAPRVDDLLTVWGLDITLDNREGLAAIRNAQLKVAEHFDLHPVLVATNLRSSDWWTAANWAYIAHGSALAAIGLALEKRYENLLIPSTHRYDALVPWGSHPLTDPLLSTRSMRVIHEGAGFSRVEKTARIAQSEIAMTTLQVCWATQSFENCNACDKCCRTATTLRLLGALDRCPSLSDAAATPAMILKFFPRDASSLMFSREIRELARRKRNRAVLRAVDRSIRKHHYYTWRKAALRRLGGHRFLRLLREPLAEALASWSG